MKYRMMFGLLWVSAFASAEVYRWVDSDGKVHYGDRAPQSRGESRSNKVDKVTVNNAAVPDPQAEEARRQLRQLEESRQRARAYESQQIAAQQKQNDRLATNCKALLDDIRDERDTAVFFSRDDAGNRVVWTSEQRLAYREKLQNLKQQHCAGAAE